LVHCRLLLCSWWSVHIPTSRRAAGWQGLLRLLCWRAQRWAAELHLLLQGHASQALLLLCE
jgi:hypothetical protein